MKRTLCDGPKNNPASNILDLRQSKLVTCKLCVNTCKNGFDPSYISNPPQPKPVKKIFLILLKMQRNLYFTIFLVKFS